MNGDALCDQLREAAWRRKLTEAELAALRASRAAPPEAQVDLEVEAALTEGLGRLEDVPVASNFTARVLQAVERETAERSRSRRGRWKFWWQALHWAPKAAAAAVVLGLGLLAYHHQQVAVRAKLAKSVVAVADVKSWPTNPEILRDFEVIRRLSQMPPADEELLTLLQ